MARKPQGFATSKDVAGFIPHKGTGQPVVSYGGGAPGYVAVVDRPGGVRAAVQGPAMMSGRAPIPKELRVSMGAPGAQKGVAAQHSDHVGMTAADHNAMAARHERVAKAGHMDQAYHTRMADAHRAAADVPVVKNKPAAAPGAAAANSPQYGIKRKSRVGTPL